MDEILAALVSFNICSFFFFFNIGRNTLRQTSWFLNSMPCAYIQVAILAKLGF